MFLLEFKPAGHFVLGELWGIKSTATYVGIDVRQSAMKRPPRERAARFRFRALPLVDEVLCLGSQLGVEFLGQVRESKEAS